MTPIKAFYYYFLNILSSFKLNLFRVWRIILIKSVHPAVCNETQSAMIVNTVSWPLF